MQYIHINDDISNVNAKKLTSAIQSILSNYQPVYAGFENGSVWIASCSGEDINLSGEFYAQVGKKTIAFTVTS